MWQGLDQNKEGAITIQSLSEACPSKLINIVRHLSDLTLYVYLKIVGNTIQKDLIGRRGVSILHYIGLRRSYGLLLRLTGRKHSLLTHTVVSYQRELDLRIQAESLYASGERCVEKSCMRFGLPVDLACADHVSLNTLKYPVGVK